MPNVQRPALSYFKWPLIALAFGVLASFALGGGFSGAIAAGLDAAFICFVLSVLETSMSFDNAAVNSKILEHWPEPWRRVFTTVGVGVAVVGMRFVFPIAIVSVTSQSNPWSVTQLAFTNPAAYANKLTAVHDLVAAFGGTFLLMVALEFFTDKTKDNHWLGWVESSLTTLGEIEAVQAMIAMSVVLLSGYFLAPAPERLAFITAGVLGLIVFVATKGIGSLVGGGDEDGDGVVDAAQGKKIIQATIGGFLYLEVLDASFSFDGVIGAFAITDYLPIIAIGLGVGALFVRELTILAVDRGTLSEYRYLENGAFWSILVLAGIMFASVKIEVPQVVTGLIGAGLIGAAFLTSLLTKDKDEAAQAAA